MLNSIKNAYQNVKNKVAETAMKNMDFNDPKVKELFDKEISKLGIPPAQRAMFQKLMKNSPELLMKIAKETEELSKTGKSQMAAAQSIMMKYQKELRDAMK